MLRFLLGVAEAGFFPGMIYYLKNWFPASTRARAVATFMTASPLAGVIAGPISGALLNMNNVKGLAGWQWMFLLEAVPSVLLSGAVLMFLAESPSEAKWLTAEQKKWLVTTLEEERSAALPISMNPWAVFKIGTVWLLAVIYFGMNTTVYGVSFWLPKLIRSQSGMSTFQIGLLTAIPYVFTAIAMVVVGLNSDRTGERRLHVAICALAGVASLVTAAHASSFVPMFIGVGLAALAANSMCGPFWAMPTGMLPPALAATGIALINSLGNTGGAFGPYMIGLLKNSSGAFRGGLLVLAAWLTIAAITTAAIPAYSTKSPPDTTVNP